MPQSKPDPKLKEQVLGKRRNANFESFKAGAWETGAASLLL